MIKQRKGKIGGEKDNILEISVDESSRVDELETLEDVERHLDAESEGDLELLVHDVVERTAGHQLSDDAEIGGYGIDTHKKQDVWVFIKV